MFIRDLEQTHYEPACNAMGDFVGKKFCFEHEIKKHYHKMSLLTHSNTGRDEEFFKTINRAYHILKNVAAREACNIFDLRLDKARASSAINETDIFH